MSGESGKQSGRSKQSIPRSRFGDWHVSEKGQRYETDTNGVADKAYDIVYAEPLHDFATMTFDRLDTEPEPVRDIARPMPFGDQPKHLNLALSKLVQWTAYGERFTDRRWEAIEIHLRNEILRAGAYGRDTLSAHESTCDDYERSRWTNGAQYFQRGARIKLSD